MTGPSVMAREMEGPIWEYVRGLLSEPELLEVCYGEERGQQRTDRRPKAPRR